VCGKKIDRNNYCYHDCFDMNDKSIYNSNEIWKLTDSVILYMCVCICTVWYCQPVLVVIYIVSQYVYLVVV
jgi:hypothetical protein